MKWTGSARGGELPLENGDRVAVIGGGPAGSLFANFFLKLVEICELDISVDLFEPRQFAYCGPAGCNHCGGIISESLVQVLAAEGIKIPSGIIQRGIDSYVLHTDVASVRVEPPGREKRIASIFRGNGPRQSELIDTVSFDAYLLKLATVHGANVEQRVVSELRWLEDRPVVVCSDGFERSYELLVLGCGVNSRLLEWIPRLAAGFEPPATVKTFITEFRLGHEGVARALGTSMHVFLLDLPGLEFAALIQKGEYVTACLLGREITDELVSSFLGAPELRRPAAAGRRLRRHAALQGRHRSGLSHRQGGGDDGGAARRLGQRFRALFRARLPAARARQRHRQVPLRLWSRRAALEARAPRHDADDGSRAERRSRPAPSERHAVGSVHR